MPTDKALAKPEKIEKRRLSVPEFQDLAAIHLKPNGSLITAMKNTE